MTSENLPHARIPRPDFFGLDRESQNALLALAKIWRDRAAARALLKVIGA